MKILMIGSGGREHAMSWKLAGSPLAEKIYVLPGNDGMSLIPKIELVPGKDSDIEHIVTKALELEVDLVVVGPERPLAMGLVDALEKAGITAFGPSKEASKLEASKVFSKKFMNELGIPTAKSKEYSYYKDAILDLVRWDLRRGIAIKADELAGGKGVVVTSDKEAAKKVLYNFMENPNCAVKTKKILIEEKLIGKEVSAFAICDGEDFIEIGYACDYKRIEDFDKGPNTGGMGGYSPKDWPSETCKKAITENIFKRVLQGMKKRGTPFKGILFVGLMINQDDPMVIEFNVRFGDPETQILMPLIEGDLLPTFLAAAKGQLKDLGDAKITLRQETSVHVVMTSEGYPSIDGAPMRLGQEITYPRHLIPGETRDQFLFIAGAKKNRNGKLVNSGGRVLGVTSLGKNLSAARHLAYESLKEISFKGAHWRKDIGNV